MAVLKVHKRIHRISEMCFSTVFCRIISVKRTSQRLHRGLQLRIRLLSIFVPWSRLRCHSFWKLHNYKECKSNEIDTGNSAEEMCSPRHPTFDQTLKIHGVQQLRLTEILSVVIDASRKHLYDLYIRNHSVRKRTSRMSILYGYWTLSYAHTRIRSS